MPIINDLQYILDHADRKTQELEARQAADPLKAQLDEFTAQTMSAQQSAFDASVEQAVDVNPDEHAKGLRAASNLGVPQGVVDDPDTRNRAVRDDVVNQLKSLGNTAPKTAKAFASNPQLAKVAHDDVPALTGIEKLLHPLADNQAVRAFKRGDAINDFGLLSFERMFGAQGEQYEKDLERTRNRMSTHEDDPSLLDDFVINSSELVGQMFDVTRNALTTGAATGTIAGTAGVAAGPGSPIAVPTLYTAGFLSGITAEFVENTFKVEAGHAYDEFLSIRGYDGETGVNQDVARGAALLVGGINAAIEVGGLRLLGKAFGVDKVLGKLGREGIKKAILTSPTMRSALSTFGKSVAAGTLIETGTEVLQEIPVMVLGEITKYFSEGAFEDIHAEEVVNRLGSIAYKVATGSFVLAGLGAAPRAYVDSRNAGKAQKNKTFFDNLDKAAADSKLKERLPEAFQEFVDEVADGTESSTVYIEARALVELFQSQGGTVQDIYDALPSTQGLLDITAATDGFVEVPLGEFATSIAGTEQYGKLSSHIKLREDEFTVAEAKDWQANHVGEFEREVEEALADTEKVLSSELPADMVYQQVFEAATNAGISQGVAQQQSALYRAIFKTLGERAGVDPVALLDSHKLQIQTAIHQLAQEEQALNQPGTPAFDKFFGDSKVVDAEGKPLVVYHGTRADIEEFRVPTEPGPNVGGRALTAERGVFFTADPAFATFFSLGADFSATGGNLVPAYLSLQNPFIADFKGEEFPYATGVGDIIEQARAAGHDGVILKDVVEGEADPSDQYIVFEPGQIKSAISNRGTYDPNDPSILNQGPVLGPEAPGVGVGKGNVHGFEPSLRVRAGKRTKLRKKGLLQVTNEKNVEAQLALIDEVLDAHQDPVASTQAWADMARDAFGSDDVPLPPYAFIQNMAGNGNGYSRMLASLTPGQVNEAQAGFDNGAKFLELYTSGAFSAADTGRLFLWSFLSRGVSPYAQEAMFLDAVEGVVPFVALAAEGKFDEAALKEYLAWAKTLGEESAGSPGRGTAHNLNAFGRSFLTKMSEPMSDTNSRSRLAYLHSLMEDSSKTGREIRREFARVGTGTGIDNKVVSFTLLVTGRTDVLVLDRVQIRAMFDDGRFAGRNLYDGNNRTSVRNAAGETVALELDVPGETNAARSKRIEQLVQSTAERRGEDLSGYTTARVTVPGSMLALLFNGARGLLYYEAMERALLAQVEQIYASIGRPGEGSAGRLHWESWVVSSQQEASHGTLDVVLREAEGDSTPTAGATARQGEYGTFQYGARYGRDDAGAYFLYPTSNGEYNRFTVSEFKELLAGIKDKANGILPKGFKVSEANNRPWYESTGVDRVALDKLVKRLGRPEPNVAEDQRNANADGPGRGPADQGQRTGVAENQETAGRIAAPIPLDTITDGPAAQQEIYGRFGELSEGDTTTSLKVYDLGPLVQDPSKTENLLSDLGFTAKYFAFHEDPDAGVEFVIPRLVKDGYDAGTLWIYNPAVAHASFKDVEYTRQWRLVHEAGHAISEQFMQERYGDSNRYGRLGRPMIGQRGKPPKRIDVELPPLTLAEAQRAVEWEDVAFRTQRLLMERLGVSVDETEFAREFNINISDAVYRTLTGEFGNPGEVGFVPDSTLPDVRGVLTMLDNVERDLATAQGREPTQGYDLNTWNPVSDAELNAAINAKLAENTKGTELYQGDVNTKPTTPVDIARQHSRDVLPLRADGRVQLDNWGTQARDQIEVQFHGNGIPGAEGKRRRSDGKGYKPRLYFGLPNYERERALGPHRRVVSLDPSELYDIRNDAQLLNLLGPIKANSSKLTTSVETAHENAILEAGFKGYFDSDKGVVAYFDNVAVEQNLDETDGPQEPALAPLDEFLKDSVIKDVVYHGTTKIGEVIEKFVPELGDSFGGINNIGTWFTDSPELAAKYAEQFTPDGKETTSGAVYPSYVQIRNPWVLEGKAGFKEFVRVAKHRSNGGTDIEALREYMRNSNKDGIVIRNFDGDFGQSQNVYVVLSPEQIKSAITLNQDDTTNAPRGSIQLGDGNTPTVINLFETHDLSTFLHESGHFFLEVMRGLAADPNAPQQIKDDWATLTAWLGHAPDAPTTREQHEQFARGFEAYLFEGNSPSVELNDAFARFRAWLVQVYKHIRKLDVELNDEVRGVLDRMVASDEEIATAEGKLRARPMFDTPEASGLTPAQHAEYLALSERAHRDAVRDLELRAMADLRKQRTDEYREARERITAEVEAEYDKKPIYQILAFLRGQGVPPGVEPMKLDRAAVVRLLDNRETLIKQLPVGIAVNEGGVHPDIVADFFSVDSGQAMLLQILAAPPRAASVKATVDSRLQAEFGDVLKDGTIEEEATKAVHTDTRGVFIAAELAALNRHTGDKKETKAGVARRIAQEVLARSTVLRASKPGQYLNAEVRAARAAEIALAAKDFTGAAAQKRSQLLNHYLAREAMKAREEVDKGLRYLSKFERAGVRKNIDNEYLEQVDALLELVDLRRSTTAKDIERSQSLKAWVDQQKAKGYEPDIDDKLMLRTKQRSYKEMSVEEFRGLIDSVKSIEHLGRLKDKLLKSADKRRIEEIAEELENTARANAKWKDIPTPLGQSHWNKKVVQPVNKYNAEHLRPEFAFEELDGFKEHGIWWRTFFKPFVDAESEELALQAEYTRRLRDVFNLYTRAERARFYSERTAFEGIQHNGKPLAMNKAQMLSLALNWGNEGNRIAIIQQDSYKWTADQVAQVLDSLTERDWKFVQEVWDTIDSLWEPSQALVKRLGGTVPPKVAATPVETKFGTLRGGYYPLAYDGEQSMRHFELQEKQKVEELFGGNWLKPQTRKGHLETRVGSGGAEVRLDLSIISEHVNNVIHDITHREAVIDVDKLRQNPRIAAAIRHTLGTEFYKTLRPWIANIAADRREPSTSIEMLMRKMRHGTTVVSMGLKVTTMLVQPFGFTQSIDLLGEKWAMAGLLSYYGNPLNMAKKTQFVLERSTFMSNRMKTFDRDVRDITKNKIGRTGQINEIQATFLAGIGLFDMSVSLPTWLGAYAKSKKENQGDEARAIDDADRAVRLSQGSGGAKDLASIQRGGELQTIFTMFYSYFSVLNNMLRRRAKQTKTLLDVPRTVLSMIYLVFIPAVLVELLLGRGPDDDEDPVEWALRKTLTYPFMGYVGLRDIVGAAESGYGYQLSPIAGSFNQISETIRKAGDGDFNETFVKNAFLATSTWFAMPGRQIWLTGDYLRDYMEGETDGFSIYDALVTGNRE